MPREVWEAMAEANSCFVHMGELLEKAGKAVAEITGAEAGYITSGSFAALVLSTAACISGRDRGIIERLPDSGGLRNEVITQRRQRFSYDRAVTVAGGKLIEVGSELGTTKQDIEKAIGERTAAVLYGVYAGRREGVLSLEDVIAIAKRRGVPVIVDAAGEILPVENFKRFVAMGADLVTFSAKYMEGPNTAAILVGRKELVEAAALHSFASFETNRLRTLGRGMKLDRWAVVALIVALRRWLKMDHKTRLEGYKKTVDRMARRLEGVKGLAATSILNHVGEPFLRLTLGKEARMTVKELRERLDAGDPRIIVGLQEEPGPPAILVNPQTFTEGDEDILIERVKEILAKA